MVRIESYASGARNRYDLPSFLLASLRLCALLAAPLRLLLGRCDIVAVDVRNSFQVGGNHAIRGEHGKSAYSFIGFELVRAFKGFDFLLNLKQNSL